MIVAGRESVEVVQAMKSDSVFRSIEANGGGETRDLALGNVVRRLRAEEEAVAADDGVRGDGRALGGTGQRG